MEGLDAPILIRINNTQAFSCTGESHSAMINKLDSRGKMTDERQT